MMQLYKDRKKNKDSLFDRLGTSMPTAPDAEGYV